MIEKFQDKYRISSSRLRNWDYSQDGIYFITICTACHECYLGKIKDKKMILSEIGDLVQIEWEKSFVIRSELICDHFVIMPNHLHAILRIKQRKVEYGNYALNVDKTQLSNHERLSKSGVAYRSPKSISSFVAGFKSAVTVKAHTILVNFDWQARFHDHLIFNDREYYRIANYILNNPANWGQDQFYKDEYL